MHLDISEYQSSAHKTSVNSEMDVVVFGLLGEAGAVASAVKQTQRDSSSKELLVQRVGEELGDLIWYAAEIATLLDIKLQDCLSQNLEKASSLFDNREAYFDTSTDPKERFPSSGIFSFRTVAGKVVVALDGEEIGNPLDDNSHEEDGYRFHDVFHMAFMNQLGWSPVMRRLLDCKRREGHDEHTDRVEDGARARFLEEGLTALIFSQNRHKEGVSTFADPANIPFGLITSVKSMTEGLEVRARSVTRWRDAIAIAFAMFDQLTSTGGGDIKFDNEARTFEYSAANE